MAMAAAVGLGAIGVISSIQSGRSEAKSLKRQGEYNAMVYEQQAEMVAQQKKLQEYQDNRAAAKMRGAVIARTGKNGFELGGSPLAVLVDNETQMELDKQIGAYNYDVQRTFLKNQASFTRYEYGQQARLAKATGYMNAFKMLLGTAMQSSGPNIKGSSTGSGSAYGSNAGQAYSSYTYAGGV